MGNLISRVMSKFMFEPEKDFFIFPKI